MFNTILTSYDGSDHSKAALRMATGLAKAFGAELHLAHTPEVDTPSIVLEAFLSELEELPTSAEIGEAAAALVEEARGIVEEEGGKVARVHVGGDHPAKHTLSIAEDIEADLIVTGRRGFGAVRALALGSVSQAVAHGAKCPCLTVV